MRLGGIIGEIIGACIGLFIIENVPNWHLPFFTSSYTTYIPIGSMVIIITAILRIIMYAIPVYRINRLFEIAANAVNIYGLVALLTIFPFDFSTVNHPELDTIFRLGLELGIFGLSIATLIAFVRLIVGPKQG